jgi:hypothetical protein
LEIDGALLPPIRYPAISAGRARIDVVFSTYLQRAFHGGLLLPVLFIFLPLTTIVYAWEINSHMPMAGINLLWMLIAVIIDLGGLGANRGAESHSPPSSGVGALAFTLGACSNGSPGRKLCGPIQ